jgi:RNA polymerase sigma-70 factor (ECF subfamily)
MQHGHRPPIDDGAFRQLFDDTYPAVVAYARRRVAPDRVDDVVAEVYATVWRRRADLDPTASPLPWLYRVAANVIRNLRRGDERRLRLVERIEAQPPPAIGGELPNGPAANLRAALERLSPDDQEVLRLVAWEGLSHAEVGQAMDCSTNAVGIRIHRARKRLEIELDRLANPLSPSDPPQPRTQPSTQPRSQPRIQPSGHAPRPRNRDHDRP